MDYLIGALSGFVFLAIYSRTSKETLADAAYTAFAVMVAIYVGAHLATSDFSRIVYEAAGATLALGLALFLREKWPVGLGPLIFCHGAYDFAFGHAAGVAPWYPPVCVGFDLCVGLGVLVMANRSDQRA